MNEVKTVRLLKPHTHSGRRYLPGAELTLVPRLADWLVEQRIADVSGTAVPATAEAVAAALAPPVIRRTGCCGRGW